MPEFKHPVSINPDRRNDEMCGNCAYRYNNNCGIFLQSLNSDNRGYWRCSKCLAAEKVAKPNKE